VLTLTAARTDDVLAGVTVPVSGSAGPSAGQTSHLEQIRQELPANTAPATAAAAPAILPALARIS
jgi:phospholipase C